MADVPFTQLLINDVERSRVGWAIDPEEVLGGVGRCTLIIYDFDLSYEPVVHSDIKLKIRSTGWRLFHGEIVSEPVELMTGEDFRVWKLNCADLNGELPQRLVGALDGKTWQDPTGFGFFVNIDPFAASLRTDKLTVQAWFDHYIRINGQPFDTDTYVFEYLHDFTPIIPESDTLQGSLEKLAALVVQNLQFWVDPDDKVHWVTIPAWYDLAQDQITVELDNSLSRFPTMMPEAPAQLLIAPANATDITADLDGDTIGFSRLLFEYDGSAMPEQIYVRGGTGYVYNAPPISPVGDTKTVVKAPVKGVSGPYQCTLLSSTRLWHTDSTGYVAVASVTVAAGGPWPVKYIFVPWNETRQRGGHFWKFLSGPNEGLLADNDTNYFGYGSIKVELVTSGPLITPQVGEGGSGWVNSVDQDPNKRQAYLDAAISVDVAGRDSFGGQALYRGKFPTLRGSVTVQGIDGWRAGQFLKITDSRLPAALNNKYFVIQRVKVAELLAEAELVRYTLDWGDGPQSRFSADQKQSVDASWPPPAIQIDISVKDLSPGPNSTQIIIGQLINGSGGPWAIANKTVNWSFECYDRAGTLQTGQGSIAPTVSITDKHGRAYTKLTTGAGTNLVYFMFARVKAT